MDLNTKDNVAAGHVVKDIGLPPMTLPVTKLPAGIHPGFVIGESDRIHDTRIVAYAIMCEAEYKVGDRELSGTALGLHEVVLYRRFYEELSGSVRIGANWPPGINRLRPLTQEQLQAELNRMKVTFVVPKGQTVMDLTSLYLGSEPAEQIRRLHTVMRRQMEAWAKLVEIAKGRVPVAQKDVHPEMLLSLACDHITPRELEEVANIADPSRDGVGDVELPEAFLPSSAPVASTTAPGSTLSEIEAQANAEVDSVLDPASSLLARLKAEGITDGQAMDIASLVDVVGGSATIADADIIERLGSKAKLAAVRKALKG